MSLNRQKEIEKASYVGIAGNLLLAALSIAAGGIAGSLALVGAGLDTSTDIISSVITLFAAKLAAKPPDREHPYGHGRAETLATKLLSFVIFFAGAQLALTSAQSLIAHEPREVPGFLAVVISCVSLGGKVFLYWYKNRIGRRINSAMVLADAKNMLGDVLLSGSVLAGLVLSRIFANAYIDQILACLVSLWIMRTAFSIFMETNEELMDGVRDDGIYRDIFAAVKTVEGAGNPHRVRVRKLNTLFVIDMDIEVDGQKTVAQGHRIAAGVEKAIKEAVDDVYDIIVHVEPTGNLEAAEQYGLCEENLPPESP